ncbi:MAG: alanine--tRNA ligase [bacterium]
MRSNELRKKYIDFFVSKNHVEIPSASLIPENDPSVLFTTAGMHPLVPYLLGEEHPAGSRLVDYQKCVRTGDIDEVGDNTHLTFFEMLGNWSLGDYFKGDAVEMSFEFLTSKEWLGLPIERLAISVFAGDDDAPFDQESFDKWKSLGIDESRIAKLGKADNWWPAGGKHPGPQGPDTEMFYWTGEGDAPEVFDPENDEWVEIWNNVFMQFNKLEDGTLEPLDKKNVDTGMGLERTVAALQGENSVFDTDLFAGIFGAIEKVTEKKYRFTSGDLGYDEKPECWDECARSMRIIADHARSAVMIINDGIEPSNKDQGYILRRLIRRAVRQMLKITEAQQSLLPVTKASIDSLSDAYPDLLEHHDYIQDVIQKEEGKFYKTVEKGLKQIQKIWEKTGEITGHDAFDLYQSYGFPIELTEEIASEHGQKVDRDAFQQEFKKHQELSRAGAGDKFAGGLADDSTETTCLHTATHLMLAALRTVLGDQVEQRGSNITADRLRFDFSHDKKVTREELDQVEEIVNKAIEADLPVRYELLTVDEAKKKGAVGIFDEKYDKLGKIKVYFVGDDDRGYVSKEICGGPHVERTGELGKFTIKKEEASSAGVRRIKATLSK